LGVADKQARRIGDFLLNKTLAGKVALVAGATRGAGRGIAVELGAAGATVYVTGRSTRLQRSEYDRPETIEETADLVTQAGGQGIAVPTDHLDTSQVQALVARIDAQHGPGCLSTMCKAKIWCWYTPVWTLAG
jgi:NAD(P)-dependent dehydrogenase (short-subunit alcohol dehydrogenase family)